MTPKVRIKPRAHEDLRNIGHYTLRQWGRQQRDVYLRGLDERFAWMAERPRRGRKRDDIAEGYYSFLYGSHVVFYLIREGGIDMIGVPHNRWTFQGISSETTENRNGLLPIASFRRGTTG